MREPLLARTQGELFDTLARLECEPPLQIRVLVAGSNEPVHSLVSKESPFPIRIHERGDFSVGAFDYQAGGLRFKGDVFFCGTRFERISYLVSVCSGIVWERSIMRLARSLYPSLVPVFFSQQEMLDLLQQAKQIFPATRLRIVGHTRKKRLKTGTRRKYETSRTRTEKSLETVFEEAEEQNFWFQSVGFEYTPERENNTVDFEGSLPSATLSKYGAFFCTSGFDRFLHGVLNQMVQIANRKMTFFSNRSRRSIEQFKARPITITFTSPAFRSVENNTRFSNIIRKMPRISCSVLHNNPYIHLSVVDTKDGSGTDLWVLKEDEIMLVPQLKASEAALKRLVNYIFEEWREGEVSSASSTDAV